MSILIIVCITLGFYLFYNSAEKSIKSDDKVSVFLNNNTELSKLTCWFFLVISFVMSYQTYGLMAGITFTIVFIMCLGSSVVLIFPLILKSLENKAFRAYFLLL